MPFREMTIKKKKTESFKKAFNLVKIHKYISLNRNCTSLDLIYRKGDYLDRNCTTLCIWGIDKEQYYTLCLGPLPQDDTAEAGKENLSSWEL